MEDMVIKLQHYITLLENATWKEANGIVIIRIKDIMKTMDDCNLTIPDDLKIRATILLLE